MATVSVLVCDHCGTMEDVLSYAVQWGGGGEGDVDLCEEGRKPIEALLALRGGVATAQAIRPAPRRTAARRTSPLRSTTMGEIAKKKG